MDQDFIKLLKTTANKFAPNNIKPADKNCRLKLHDNRRSNKETQMITTKTNAETSKRVVAQMATQTVTQMESLPDAYELFAGMRDSCRQRVQGRDDVIDLAIIALLSDGHILLEDHPGSGKTTLAKALGECIVRKKSDSQMASFRRIQFTPDLLPSDVTGTTIFDPDSNTFHTGLAPSLRTWF